VRGEWRRGERAARGRKLSVAVGECGAWSEIGRAAAEAASLPRRIAQTRARDKTFPAPAGEARGLSRAANGRLFCRAGVFAPLLEILLASLPTLACPMR
jgi:hypothetical protein